MVISSRTPEVQPNRCHVCGSEVKIEPADPAETPRVLAVGIYSGLPGKTWVMSMSSNRRKTCSRENRWTVFWTRWRSNLEFISYLI